MPEDTCANCAEQITRDSAGIWWHVASRFLRCDRDEWSPAVPVKVWPRIG